MTQHRDLGEFEQVVLLALPKFLGAWNPPLGALLLMLNPATHNQIRAALVWSGPGALMKIYFLGDAEKQWHD